MRGFIDSSGRMLCMACGRNIEHEPDSHKCDPPESKIDTTYPIDTGRTFSDRLRDAELLTSDD